MDCARLRINAAAWLGIGLLSAWQPGLGKGRVTEILAPIPVATASVNVFSTPLAYHRGAVYTVNVEPAAGVANGINLRTVVRQGRPDDNGQWHWAARLIDDQTLEDPYHTQASIGVDRAGYVHVAYNMHNMPWQYAVSARPENIGEFVFMGEPISWSQRVAVRYLNKTPFPALGSASIPGNQITYPAFYHDRERNLYVTYRYATRPKRAWQQRGLAAGLARYDVDKRRWSALGGGLRITDEDAELPPGQDEATTLALAYERGWSPYLLRMWFDRHNGMHLSWTWREGGPGRDTSLPSYAYSPDEGLSFYAADGTPVEPPLGTDQAVLQVDAGDYERFYPSTAVAAGDETAPVLTLHPIGGERFSVRFDARRGRWSPPLASPYGASRVIIDDTGVQWAFATGPRILRRDPARGQAWQEVYRADGYCFPKVLPLPEEGVFLVHVQSCELDKVKILRVDMQAATSRAPGQAAFARS